MIVKVNRTSVDSGICQTQVTLPQGATKLKLLSLRLPKDTATRFKEFPDAVVANGATFTVPAQTSIAGLVSFMNGIVAPDRVFESWFNASTNDFELLTRAYPTVTLSAEFAEFFEFPTATIVSFESGRINEASNPVHEYVVEVDGHDGASDGTRLTHAIGYVDPQGKPYNTNVFRLARATSSISVRIKYRLKTGELFPCACPDGEMWSVCLQVS